MKFELLKLLSHGFPFDAIPELEQSEFNDWLAASRALDIDKKLMLINVALSPNRKSRELVNEFTRLKNEQLLLLGDNPFTVDHEEIERSRERLKKQGKVTRTNGNNNKRNTRKIKT